VPFGDLNALQAAITPNTVAVLVEPIQGEGGVRVASPAYLRGIHVAAEQHRLLVIYDEVQTGLGRTGAMFAYQHSGMQPDVLLLAKTIGGGFPLGATIATRALSSVLGPGTHASTFGGSPLACACGLAVLEAIRKQKLLERVNQLSPVIVERLRALQARCPIIHEVRGQGFMVGIELTIDGRPLVEACRARRVLINCTQERVLRLLPALTITRAQLDQGLAILEEVLTHASVAGHRPVSRTPSHAH
jgi:acetylornithine/succinyldiaminopimelate/putrescine aminotransferase